jgi:hypothetical protein
MVLNKGHLDAFKKIFNEMSDACVAVSASSYLVGASAFELHTFTHRR